VERSPLAPGVPRSIWLWVSGYFLFFWLFWSFIANDSFPSEWIAWAIGFLFSVIFVSNLTAVAALATLLPGANRPGWLSRRKALVVSAVGIAIQSVAAGVGALAGVWPYPDLWYLGAFAFLIGS
jgi:hypothetical protein